MHIFWGVIMISLGLYLVIKTEIILKNFGRIAFFEKHLGSDGGSRLGYKLLGVLIIFLGTVIMFNMGEKFLTWILSPLINAGS